MGKDKINIAIDGYSSCGKGTLAKFLAHTLGYKFIDSGSMYRAVTLQAIRLGADVEIPEQVIAILPTVELEFVFNPQHSRFEIELIGENIESEIRTLEVASKVSQVARISQVRQFLVQQQREIAKEKGVVMDGRDIGTVVLPDAELKIFMTARPEVRAQRRLKELVDSGRDVTFEEVLSNITHRDQIDSSREDSPLTLTSQYKVLDNSDISPEEQNQIALTWAQDALRGA